MKQVMNLITRNVKTHTKVIKKVAIIITNKVVAIGVLSRTLGTLKEELRTGGSSIQDAVWVQQSTYEVLRIMCCLAQGGSRSYYLFPPLPYKQSICPMLVKNKTKKTRECKTLLKFYWINLNLLATKCFVFFALDILQFATVGRGEVTLDMFQPGSWSQDNSAVHPQPVKYWQCSSLWNANSQAGCGHAFLAALTMWPSVI